MCAFAANSVLCRIALRAGEIDPASFTLIRIASGAAVLVPLALFQGRFSFKTAGSWLSSLGLVGYAAFFSFSYVQIDAGIGALTLFLVVQLTMIGWNRFEGKRLDGWERSGLVIALAGLGLLTLPGNDTPALRGLILMAIAGVCWGAYSLRGRGAKAPIALTAGNFLKGVPAAALVFAFYGGSQASAKGALLAAASGALTSGLGYSLWYTVLPRMTTSRAAIAQLSVPALTVIGGVLFLGEIWTIEKAVSASLMFSGVVLAVRPWRKK